MNIKTYTYSNIIGTMAIPAAIAIVLSIFLFHLDTKIIFIEAGAFIGITLLLMLNALSDVRKEIKIKEISDADIYRDFVTSLKRGKLCIGDKYIYKLQGFKMRLFDVDDIKRIYITDLTTVDYVADGGRYRKRTRQSSYLTIKMNSGNEVQSRFSKEVSHGIMEYVRMKLPQIPLGYVENE